MFEGADRLVGHVLPDVPVRQWVLSLPYDLRRALAWAPEALDRILRVFTEALARCLRALGLRAGVPEPRWGAVTVIQRFGASLNPHVHFHTLVLDGAFSLEGERPRWVPLCLRRADVAGVLQEVRRRVDGLLGRGADSVTDPEGASFERRGSAPCGRGQRRVRRPMLCRTGTYELDASVRIPRGRRRELLRLCRYVLRPSFSPARCDVRADGAIVVPIPRGDGALVLSPADLALRLLALVAPPRRHTVRYHGILAPNASGRGLVVPRPRADDAGGVRPQSLPKSGGPPTTTWRGGAGRRPPSPCPVCGGRRRVIAAVPWIPGRSSGLGVVLEAPD